MGEEGMKQYGSLKIMGEELSEYHFPRIHKSYPVNPRCIAQIGIQEIKIELEFHEQKENIRRENMMGSAGLAEKSIIGSMI